MADAPLPPQERIGYALVGLGELSLSEILPALQESQVSRLGALVSDDLTQARDIARRYGLPENRVYDYGDLEQLAQLEDVQAVYILLPNHLHLEYTLRAAAIGKHVLCEKPMANTPEDCERMIAACREHRVKLMVAYRVQYEPHHNLVRQWVQEQRFGRVKLVEAVNSQLEQEPNQWRLKRDLAGGGPLPDLGIYCLNTIRFLLGEEPIEVSAFLHQPGGDPRWREVEESLIWSMRFPSGVLAQCTTSYGVHESRRYRVYGEQGWFGMDPAFPYQGLRIELGYRDQGVQVREERSLGEPNQFALELDHFSLCIREDREPMTPGEEGLQDVRLIQALYRSARENKPILVNPASKADSVPSQV